MKPKAIAAVLLLALLPALLLASMMQDHAAELKTLQQDYDKDWKTFFDPYTKMKTDEERMKFDWSGNPSKTYVPKAKDLAVKARGTDAGAATAAWIWRIALNGPADAEGAKFAASELIEHYPKSKELGAIVGQLAWGFPFEPAEARGMLKKIIDNGPHPDVLPNAYMALAQGYMGDGNASKEDAAEAKRLYTKLMKEFPSSAAAKRAEGSIFEIENLQVGMKAPDFDAVDENGKQWKLSDYKGKVVVVDFWGFW